MKSLANPMEANFLFQMYKDVYLLCNKKRARTGGITCRFRMDLLQCNALFPFLFKKNHDTLVQKNK